MYRASYGSAGTLYSPMPKCGPSLRGIPDGTVGGPPLASVTTDLGAGHRPGGRQMSVQPHPRDLVRVILKADYNAFENSIDIVREKHAGNDAAFAVTFEDRNGTQRQGVLGLSKRPDGAWRPSAGFMGSFHVPGERDVWISVGGWGGDSRDHAVYGGWVADPTATTARATDEMTGRTLDAAVENGVVLFMYEGGFGLHYGRLDLFDAEGRVLRTGPLHRRR